MQTTSQQQTSTMKNARNRVENSCRNIPGARKANVDIDTSHKNHLSKRTKHANLKQNI